MAAAAGYASMEGYSNTEYPEICPPAGCVYGFISQNYLLRRKLSTMINQSRLNNWRIIFRDLVMKYGNNYKNNNFYFVPLAVGQMAKFKQKR